MAKRLSPAAWVFILALGVRLAYCAFAVFVMHKPAPGGPSHDGYIEIARSLAAGDGYRLAGEANFFRPPTYVVFLIPWVLLPGTQFWILFIQSLVGALTCALVAKLAESSAGSRAAFFAGIAMALCPWHVHFTANAMTPVLATFLTTTLLWFSQRLADRELGWRAGLAGANFAALALCHPSAVLIGPCWIALRALSGYQRTRWPVLLRDGTIFAISAALLFTPWLIRNYRAGAGLLPLSNSSGFQAFVSEDMVTAAPTLFSVPLEGIQPGLRHAQAYLESLGVKPNAAVLGYKGVGLTEGRLFDAWMKQHLLEDWGRFGRRVFLQGWWFWFGDTPELVPFHIVFKGALLVLAIAAILRGRCNTPTAMLCVTVILCYWAIHSVVMGFIPHAAYSVVATAPLAVLAGMGFAPQRSTIINNTANPSSSPKISMG